MTNETVTLAVRLAAAEFESAERLYWAERGVMTEAV